MASLLSSGGADAASVSAVGSLLRLRWLAYVLNCVLKDVVAKIENKGWFFKGEMKIKC